jgi:hypothetical protein
MSSGTRKHLPRRGVVSCPDGRLSFDLNVMRSAQTRLMLSGELTHAVGTLADQAGLSRSTVSRMFHGRLVSIAALLAVLSVLGLTVADVTSSATTPAEETGAA